jgi:hypothetical protein
MLTSLFNAIKSDVLTTRRRRAARSTRGLKGAPRTTHLQLERLEVREMLTTLPSGGALALGQSLLSPNGQYQLILGTDGSLAEYGPGHQRLWAEMDSQGETVTNAVMDPGGDFIVYGDPNVYGSDNILWDSNTDGTPGATLSVQNNGDVALMSPSGTALWDTGTTGGMPAGNRILTPGQSVSSANGQYRLTLQSNGNLAEYGLSGANGWSSNTTASTSAEAIMQYDGNFVLYGAKNGDGSNSVLWASGTAGNFGATLTVQNNGKITVLDDSGSTLWTTPTPPAPPSTIFQLLPGQSLSSPNGQYGLTLQAGGNLAETGPGGQVLWVSNTAGQTVNKAVMQSDGNFVLYGPMNVPVWSTGTNGNSGSVLTVQNSGNVVVGNNLWQTYTTGGMPAANFTLTAGLSFSFPSGYRLSLGTTGLMEYDAGGHQTWASPATTSPAVVAEMQYDGNLVIYGAKNANGSNNPLWATGTNGNAGAKLTSVNDGNLIVSVSVGAVPLWSAAPYRPFMLQGSWLFPGQDVVSPNGQYWLTLQTDGNLVEYGPLHQALWATNTAGVSVVQAVMQTDGNFALYGAPNADGTPNVLWSTHTGINSTVPGAIPGYAMAVENTGNVVVDDALGEMLWSTGTTGGMPAAILTLTAGQSISSPNGQFTLMMFSSGLVEYDNTGRRVWTSPAMSSPAVAAEMQFDGNFVIYGAKNADGSLHPLWATNTYGNHGAALAVQNDGFLSVSVVSGSPTIGTTTLWSQAPITNGLGGGLIIGGTLYPGSSVTSVSGLYTLTLQTDGNLVEYGPGNQALWSSGTNGRTVVDAVMQSDGNFVIYGGTNYAIWASSWSSHVPLQAGASLGVQDDGNIVIRNTHADPLWSTGTANGMPTAVQTLALYQSISSSNGMYTLILEPRGLVEYDFSGDQVWASPAISGAAVVAEMQTDGNLVIYGDKRGNFSNNALWATGTNGLPGTGLMITDQGAVIVAGGPNFTFMNYGYSQYGAGNLGYGNWGYPMSINQPSTVVQALSTSAPRMITFQSQNIFDQYPPTLTAAQLNGNQALASQDASTFLSALQNATSTIRSAYDLLHSTGNVEALARGMAFESSLLALGNLVASQTNAPPAVIVCINSATFTATAIGYSLDREVVDATSVASAGMGLIQSIATAVNASPGTQLGLGIAGLAIDLVSSFEDPAALLAVAGDVLNLVPEVLAALPASAQQALTHYVNNVYNSYGPYGFTNPTALVSSC